MDVLLLENRLLGCFVGIWECRGLEVIDLDYELVFLLSFNK